VSTPRPLLESSTDDFERSLLQAVKAELPGGLGLRTTALALGLAGSTADALAASLAAAGSISHAGLQATSTVATSSAATSGAATSSGAVGAVGTVSLGVVGKSLIGGALVSFLALTTLDHSLRSSSSSPHARPPARAAGPTVASSARPAASALPIPPQAPTTADVPALPPVAPVVAPASGRQLSSHLTPSEPAPSINAAPTNAAFSLPPRPEQALPGASSNASLAAEIQLLDQVRAALAQGNAARAGQLLDRYASNQPSAVLAQEAALLRVRLLLSRGQRPAAAELARRIIHEHPESAHVDSLRGLAAEP